jgi:hypothetical protein
MEGTYQLRISVTGYVDLTLDDVRVLADREITLRAELVPSSQ